jgi:hypothetical protein
VHEMRRLLGNHWRRLTIMSDLIRLASVLRAAIARDKLARVSG